MSYIIVSQDNIDSEHICCGFSDKKCAQGYQLKKEWLKQECNQGYTFRRLDERAKVFIEYGPAETAWVPVNAPNYLMIGCFWVSGKYKQQGHGRALLQQAVDAAREQNKDGLVTVVGSKKFHFMSDTRWLLRHGFETSDVLDSGFSLLTLDITGKGVKPHFKSYLKTNEQPEVSGCTVFYSNRCPFTEYYVTEQLVETCRKRNIPLQVIKLETFEQAQSAPTPATIFSLYYNGRFITTDISASKDNRFDKFLSPDDMERLQRQ